MSGRKTLRVVTILLALTALVWLVRTFLVREEAAAERSRAVAAVETALYVQRDDAAALKLLADALRRDPDDARLHLLRGEAYLGRRRHGDALESLRRAQTLADDPELGRRAELLAAVALANRFVELRQREDWNRAERTLRAAAAGGEHAAEARLLLGLALAQPGPVRNAAEARRFLEEGFAAGPPATSRIVDLAAARRALDGLLAEAGG